MIVQEIRKSNVRSETRRPNSVRQEWEEGFPVERLEKADDIFSKLPKLGDNDFKCGDNPS
jgi:hypothetical protein